MPPNISHRTYIRWLPDPPTEPTTTLVLTSPENRFVDIRILKQNPFQPFNLHHETTEDVLHTTRLDWAFAGTSSSDILLDPDGSGQVVGAHSTWRHWIDSGTDEPENVNDEGDMFPQPDGRTLEKGRMINPASGKMSEYEECWKDEDATATVSAEKLDADATIKARSQSDGDDAEEKKVCIVLLLDSEEIHARGMVIRVGQYCQGILRVGKHFTLERWMWEEDGGWKRRARMGDLWLPCGVVLDRYQKVSLGGHVTNGEFVWQCVEWIEF